MVEMIAAVYARKSTDQTGVVDDQRSVARQIEHARAYAYRKGWRVDDAHVYVDDGISGAEFKRRPGLQRLLAAIKPRAPFQILIVSEQKSLGREQFGVGTLIKELAQAGVEVFGLNRERVALLDEIQDLTTAIAAGGDIPALALALKEGDKKLRALDSRLVPRPRPERDALREALTLRAAEWRTVLRGNVRQARMVLQQLMGPIMVHATPRGTASERARWMAEPRPEGLLVGIMGRGDTSPAGTVKGCTLRFSGVAA